MPITFVHRGQFEKTSKFFLHCLESSKTIDLRQYGEKGVNALMAATPKDTGKTAASWTYGIDRSGDSTTIYWTNTNVNNGVNIAVILQYGHGTRNGGYVKGIDYINPAIRPIFEEIANDAWKEVSQS